MEFFTNILALLVAVGLLGIWWFIKKQPNTKNRNVLIVFTVICFILFGVLRPGGENKVAHDNTSTTTGPVVETTIERVEVATTETKTVETAADETTQHTVESVSFEEQIKKLNIFNEVEYNHENGLYIISENLTLSLGDKNAIQIFNAEIKTLLDKGIVTDKPVVFRGWFENGGYTVAGSVVYFSTDTFNLDWNSRTILDSDVYKYSDGWISASKFGQYQSSTNGFKIPQVEEPLHNIFQLSK